MLGGMGKAAGRLLAWQSSAQICYTLTLEWPTFVLALRSRRHGQLLKP